MLFVRLRLCRLQPLILLSSKSLINSNCRLLSCSSSSSSSSSSTTPQNPKAPEYWTEEVQYLDESNNLISTSVAARPSIPDLDTPPSTSAAASRIADAVLRHGWGPDLHLHLSRLPFVPDPSHLSLAFSLLLSSSRSPPHPHSAVSASLSLLRWARLNLSFIPDDPTLSLIVSRLSSDPDSVSQIFDEDVIKDPDSFPSSANLAIQLLCKASRIEIAFCCFKKLKDKSFAKFDIKTYNSLIAMFLTKGLPYKAFEIYESCSDLELDLGNYELMITALAKSGRIDGALKMFDEMKRRGERPGLGIYSVLVDCMGKAGRLDAAVGVYREMQAVGYKPNGSMYVSMIESLIKSGKLDAGKSLWQEMKGLGFRPNFGLYTLMVEAHAKSGRLEAASGLFDEMEKSGFLPTPSTFSCLIEMHSAGGNVDSAMRLYNSMNNAGFRLGMSVYTSLLSVLANKKLLDLAAKILLEMKANGFSVDVNASDVLMIYIKDGSTELGLRWLRFMGSVGIRTNNFIIRQLFESCMKAGLYDSAKPLLETYVGSAAKVDLILYTSILAHLVRCQDEKKERAIMDIMSTTKHGAHEFMCGLFTGPEQRKKPVLSFVRDFFQGIDYELEESAARYFVNVLLNYLVLMGQMNRARCVWKVAYENKLFPKAIVFDQHIAWSLDVRNLSVGAALVAVVHTLHRFRKRMLYYGVVPRRIKLVTGSMLKMVVAQVLASVESPFEVSKVVLRAPGDSVLEWFKKPIVQQFLLNEIPSKSDVLMHKLNVMFPSSAPEVRLLSPPKPSSLSKVMY